VKAYRNLFLALLLAYSSALPAYGIAAGEPGICPRGVLHEAATALLPSRKPIQGTGTGGFPIHFMPRTIPMSLLRNAVGRGQVVETAHPETDTLYNIGYGELPGTRHLYHVAAGDLVIKRPAELRLFVPIEGLPSDRLQTFEMGFPKGASDERVRAYLEEKGLTDSTQAHRIGNGGFSIVFKLHSEGNDLHPAQVIKIRNPSDLPNRSSSNDSANALLTDLITQGIAEQLLSRVHFRGERLIYNAKILSTSKDLKAGIIRQEYSDGMDPRELALAADVILAPASPREAIPPPPAMSPERAHAVLEKAGLLSKGGDAAHAAKETIQYLAALEQTHRELHYDVINARTEAGVSQVLNRTHDEIRQVKLVGFDLNHGQNYKWVPGLRAFVRFD